MRPAGPGRAGRFRAARVPTRIRAPGPVRAGAAGIAAGLSALLLASVPAAAEARAAPVVPGQEPAAATEATADTGTVAVTGATLIDGTGAPPVEDAVVLVRDGRIAAAGPRAEVDVPPGARAVDASGRWVVPGLIDAHVHFSQTGWFDGRPDALDLRDRFPYAEVTARLREEPERFFEAYLCSGVTSVFDVGGYPWTLAMQERTEGPVRAPRVIAAGPLLSTIDFWLNLPEARQFVHMADDSVVRAAVESLAERGAAAIKVWYLFPPEPPDSARMRGLMRTAVEAAGAEGLPVIAHATGLWQAKDAVRAGARVLVHSVFADTVDEEFVRLLRERDAIYTPTVTVVEGYANAYEGDDPDDLPYPTRCVDEGTRARLAEGIPAEKAPSPEELERRRDGVARQVETGLANLRRLHEAGVTVAMGTDAGNPGTLHGPSVHREMVLYRRAGLSPMEVLVTATRNAARAAGRGDDLGTLEPGKRADFLILDGDPTASLDPLRRPLEVWKAGARMWPPATGGRSPGSR